ncbi:MAG TPA: V-type ATP synthase subunit E family protein [Candidatus Thalassarchaeaceae archaeon]|nr:V-type ATP synthase subunit E family protein [Candidatus Thalassarchaeaceae archaeon]
MSLDALASEIATAAKKEAKAITSDAEAEAKSILDDAKAVAAAFHDDAVVRAERESTQIETESVASTRQANQNAQLVAKREELDATWAAAKGEVASAKLSGRTDLLKHLVSDAKKDAEKNMILCPVALDRAALEKAGTGFDIGDDVSGLGGFVLQTEDGSVVLDYRFDGRLEDAWSKTLSSVSTTLFGDA